MKDLNRYVGLTLEGLLKLEPLEVPRWEYTPNASGSIPHKCVQ